MLYTIQNERLRVQVSSRGAELQSIRLDGTEYLWQGDPAIWSGRSPLLFPICCRLWDNRYTWQGKSYDMTKHGFARRGEFTAAEQGADRLVLALEATEETLACYPFRFRLTVAYALEGTSLRVSIGVENREEPVLIFAVGAHPGFLVPMGGEGSFEDCYVEFDRGGDPRILLMSPDYYMSGETVPANLEDGCRLSLRHSLFDDDAIIFAGTSRAVTLRSRVSGRSVRMEFPQMPYLGIWHAVKTEAPYVCLEPWSSLPSFQGELDDLETKRDMVHLSRGERYENTCALTFR